MPINVHFQTAMHYMSCVIHISYLTILIKEINIFM